MGTVIGGLSDWRWTMYFVAFLGAAAAAGILFLLKQVPLPPKVSLGARIAPLRQSRVGWTLLTTFLGMAGNFLVYIYFSVVFDRVLDNALIFGALLVVWGTSGTATNLVLAKLLDRTGARKVLLAVLAVLILDMALVPWASAQRWTSVLVVAVWGATGWGIQGPQQYRLVNMGSDIAPILLGLNTAATFLGVTVAGVLGALGIHAFGAHYLSFASAGLFALGAVTTEIASRRIAEHGGVEPDVRGEAFCFSPLE
jgi:predicted MFS family arabinose efflux permease